jgi:dienelactone hydrolase
MTFANFAGRAALAAGIVYVLGASAFAQEASWKAGRMFVPGALMQDGKPCGSEAGGKCVAGLKPGKHPVVLFLHGCGGPRTPNAFFALGVIIVAPNSFAQGQKCNENDANAMLALLKSRGQDVAFASKQLREAGYVDTGKLILAGYSQGGQLAALYPGNEFKARVMVAWTCNHKNPNLVGIKGSGPALAVLGTNDEYYRKVGISGNCDGAVASRGGPSKSVHIKGGSHEILDHAETKAAVAAFLPEVLK